MVQAVLYLEKGDWLISICESFYIKDTFDFSTQDLLFRSHCLLQ